MAVKTRRRATPKPQRTFDKLRKSRETRGKCSNCETKPTTHQITIMSRKLDDERRPGKHIASTSRNFCEDCAVEMFEDLGAIVRGENDE